MVINETDEKPWEALWCWRGAHGVIRIERKRNRNVFGIIDEKRPLMDYVRGRRRWKLARHAPGRTVAWYINRRHDRGKNAVGENPAIHLSVKPGKTRWELWRIKTNGEWPFGMEKKSRNRVGKKIVQPFTKIVNKNLKTNIAIQV